MLKDDRYKVLVCCMTYNQSPFIKDALNGFVMQKTTFPFVCLIIDDASTDGQKDILKQFMAEECDMPHSEKYKDDISDYVIARHNFNKNCVFAFSLLKHNLYGSVKKELLINTWRERCKYEAICEGDDYWTNPLKLYTQVSFMESHQDISLSCCRFDILNTRTGVKELAPNIYFDDEDVKSSFFEFTRHGAFGECGWITKTLTCVYRISAMHPEFVMQFKYGRDVHMVYDILSHGNGVCHNLNGGVYRISDSGIYGGKNNTEKALVDYRVYREFSSKVGDPQLSEISLRNFNYLIAHKHLIFPHNFRELKSYIVLFKQVIIRHIKNVFEFA